MAKCLDPQGWPKRPSAVTILGPLWPKRASEVTVVEGASPRARQNPRSRMDYSRLRRLFTSRTSPPGHFLATPRHFRGTFWPAPFRIRHRGATFWPSGPILPSAATTLRGRGANPAHPRWLNQPMTTLHNPLHRSSALGNKRDQNRDHTTDPLLRQTNFPW